MATWDKIHHGQCKPIKGHPAHDAAFDYTETPCQASDNL